MKAKFATFIAGSALVLSLGACHGSVLDNPPGTYESSTSHKNSNGTNVEQDTTTEVRYDAHGNKEAVIKTETTTDPKGLFNKETTTDVQKVKENRY